MPNAPAATPVEQLRDQALRLEAALSVGVATSTPKAVHQLRSSTRRVEAQVELLAMVKGLPSYKSEAGKVYRRLEKLRRIAGRVRDCDVQEKLLADKDHALSSAIEAPSDIKSTQEKLRTTITELRQRRERKLVATIEKQLPKLTRDTEELLAALKPARDSKVPVAELLANVEQRIEPMLGSHERGEEHLHDLRKAAKRARYQCEAMPGPRAAAMARRLESLQDAGGAWHDLLDLATVCHKELGPEHPLSRVLEHLRDERLDAYLANLEDFRNTHSQPANSKSKTQKISISASPQRKPPQRVSTSEKSSRTA